MFIQQSYAGFKKRSRCGSPKVYVAESKHLPNIPSSEELKKSQCGLNLAEMQGKQMEKIENIYLYLFEMKTEIENLKIENENLRKRIK